MTATNWAQKYTEVVMENQRLRTQRWAFATVAALIALIASLVWSNLHPPDPVDVVRFTESLPQPIAFEYERAGIGLIQRPEVGSSFIALQIWGYAADGDSVIAAEAGVRLWRDHRGSIGTLEFTYWMRPPRLPLGQGRSPQERGESDGILPRVDD